MSYGLASRASASVHPSAASGNDVVLGVVSSRCSRSYITVTLWEAWVATALPRATHPSLCTSRLSLNYQSVGRSEVSRPLRMEVAMDPWDSPIAA